MISKSMGILTKIKLFIPIKTKIMIHNSLILSHLNFSVLTWGFHYNQVIKLHKNMFEILSLSKYHVHTKQILSGYNISITINNFPREHHR